MEQKRPADIFQELLDYLWNGLGLEEKGWKRLKKGDFKKKTKNGLTYQMNCTPFVRQCDILNNKWGALLCRKEYQTNAIHQNSRSR